MLKLDLDPGEKIVLEMRKNWFVFLGPLVFFLMAALAPAIVYWIYETNFMETIRLPFLDDYMFLIKYFLYPMWILIFWVNLFIRWTNFYLDVWYVTEKRIIDIEQKSLFH